MVGKDTLYGVCFFRCVHICFIAWNMICSGKYSMCIWEICTFVTVWNIQYMSVRSCWFVVLLKYSVSLFIFLVVLLLRAGYGCLPNIIVQLFLFSSINFCFMFWWLLWAAWKFVILINLCWIEPFINTEYSSLFLIIYFDLKSILSHISIATPVSFGDCLHGVSFFIFSVSAHLCLWI